MTDGQNRYEGEFICNLDRKQDKNDSQEFTYNYIRQNCDFNGDAKIVTEDF